MRAMMHRRAAIMFLMAGLSVLSPPPGFGQSLDLPDPPCGLGGDSSFAAQAAPFTWNAFKYYKVPFTVSARANRDYEWLLSDTYKSRWNVPLDMATGSEGWTDIDRLGIATCEGQGHNPFGLHQSDLQLAYNFFAQHQTLDSLGVSIVRRSTYNSNENAPIGFRVAKPTYPDAERTHIDAYVFGREFGAYGSTPAYPGDGWESGSRIYNYGISPSKYEWAATEDSATIGDPATYHDNSLQIPGPFPSQVGSTGPGRWTRPGGLANTQLVHESLHAINYDDGKGDQFLHMFASGAEVVTGVATDRPTSDVDYRFGLTPGRGAGLKSAAYPHWMAMLAYLAFNFRGADTTAAGYLDDLVARWARTDEGQRHLPGLGRRLRDVECPECAAYPGFAGIDSLERVQRLHHDFRVSAYVNNSALPGGHYGYPAGYGFSPANQIGAWQGMDNDSLNDWAVAPPELTLGPADRGRTHWIREHVLSTPAQPRELRLNMFGAEYFILRADPALASTQQTLRVRVRLPEILKAVETTADAQSGGCQTVGQSGRLFASVVEYSGSADSLFRHSDWATSVVTATVAFDSVRSDLEFDVPGFGSGTKAALVVLTLADGSEWFYSKLAQGESDDTSPVEVGISLIPAGGLLAPQAVQPSSEAEGAPTWSPDGAKLAIRRVDGSGVSRIYVSLADGSGSTTLLRPATTGQHDPSWSSRGDVVAYAQESGTDRHLWTVNPTTGAAQQLTSMAGLVLQPAFSPNGARIAYVRAWNDAGTTHWDIRARDIVGTGDALLAAFTGDSAIAGLRWSPDGQYLLFARYDDVEESRHLYQLRVTNLNLTTHDGLAPQALLREFAPGSGAMLVEEASGFTYAQTCDMFSQLPPPYGCLCQPGVAFLPAHWIALRDTVAGTSTPIAYRTSATFSAPRFSPDGTKVAYVTTQNGNPDVYVAATTFNRAPTFTSLQASYSVPSCDAWVMSLAATDPDGEALTYEVFDMPAGAVLQSGNQLRWEYPVVGQHWLIARALDPQGAVASKVVLLDVYAGGPCGGGGGEEDPDPIIPGGNATRHTDGARLIGGGSGGPARLANTFLDGAASGIWTSQTARLVAARSDSAGQVRTRVAALRPGTFALDRARLLVVDHAPGTVAVATPLGLAVGAKHRAAHMAIAGGEDLTQALRGDAADARLFPAGSTLALEWAPADSIAGVILGCARASAADGTSEWGVRLEVPQGGGWSLAGRIHPRSSYDALAAPLPVGTAARLVFASDTYVREVAGYSLGETEGGAATVTPVELSGTDAESGVEHLALADSAAVELSEGEGVTLLFDGPPPVAERQRTLFLDLVASFTPEGVAGSASQAVAEAPPLSFALHANRPNPFGGGTTIRFDVPRTSAVRLEVFDAQGRRIRTLADGAFEPGRHALVWDGSDSGGQRARPGIYLYRMTTNGFRDQRRMVLLGR